MRTAENHERLDLTDLERAQDRADFCGLVMQIYNESGDYSEWLSKELIEADFNARRMLRDGGDVNVRIAE